MSTDPHNKDPGDKQEQPGKGSEPASHSTIASSGTSNATSWSSRPAGSGVMVPRASWEWAWPWAPAGADNPVPSALEAGALYLRGVRVANSPARGLSEWRRLRHAGDVDAFPPKPALLQIFENSENWVEDDEASKENKPAKKPNRRTLLTLPDILDDEQASGYLSEDEGPDADKESKKTSISETESPEERDSTLYSDSILEEIDSIVGRKTPRRTNSPVKSTSEWEPDALLPLPTPDEMVKSRTPPLALPLAAMRQRRRSSQMAAQRLQAIRHEIDTKLAEIDAKISGENLPPERLTYAYVMHKCKSIAGDVESSDEEHRSPGPMAPSVSRCPIPEGIKTSVWAGGAARPSGASCVARRPLTAPQALMRRRLAGRVATVLEEEQPGSMPATGDEASTTSASPEPRSPTSSRRRRVRKASAGRRRSQEPPGSSSSSSMSSSPSSHSHSAGRGGRWRSTLSPMRVLPSSVRKRPSVAGVLGGATAPKHINPFHSLSFPKTKRGG